MGIKAEKARELFTEGYNCCQAVVCAFCDELKLDFDEAARLASSFGGGMGRMREVCGAVSGMFICAGILCGYSDPKDMEAKKTHYRLIQEMANKFKENNGSIVCRELLGVEGQNSSYVPSERTSSYYKKRPCSELVYMAAEIVEDILYKK